MQRLSLSSHLNSLCRGTHELTVLEMQRHCAAMNVFNQMSGLQRIRSSTLSSLRYVTSGRHLCSGRKDNWIQRCRDTWVCVTGRESEKGRCYLHMNETRKSFVIVCDFHISGFLLLFIYLICSVQKLSEFFSSDEIGDEQEPRAMLTSGSSNHNQNRYQAVVSSWAYFFALSSREKAFVSPLLQHRGCLTLLLFFFLHLIVFFLIISLFFPFVTSLPDVMHPSSSHPLNHSLPPPPPLCPGSSSPWRWWIGSAPRGTTGTTTAHRGTTRATAPLRRWTRTPVSRWDGPLCRPPSDTSWLRVSNRMSETQTKISPLKLRSLSFSWHATSNFNLI